MFPITFAAANGGDVLVFILGTLLFWGILSVIMCSFAPPDKQVGIFLTVFLLGPIGFIIAIVYLALFSDSPKPLPPPQPVAKPVNKNDYGQELKCKLREFFDEQRYYYGVSEDTLEWIKSELPVLRGDVMRALYRNSADAADRVLSESLSKLRAECAEKDPFLTSKGG